MRPPTVLEGERVHLRPLAVADVTRLVEIGTEPEVARWWQGITADSLAEKAAGADPDVTALAIEHDDELVGLIQFHEELDPEYRHAGIDLFLTATRHGQGLGADAVSTLARHLFEERGHHRITIDPAAANERAIRSYRRVGFRPVGVMREYWRAPDGTWQDGLLLDLLRDDLVC
ncbi:MAG TPA: GNAT family protein [Gaiellales bacterium]|jgi:aminoglycoside 6'-N-acetyltransferase|nr:GNAT family protein [Gaiellales bacterium]